MRVNIVQRKSAERLLRSLELHVLIHRELGRSAGAIVTGTGGNHAKAGGTCFNFVAVWRTLVCHGQRLARNQFVERGVLSFEREVSTLGLSDGHQIGADAGDIHGRFRITGADRRGRICASRAYKYAPTPIAISKVRKPNIRPIQMIATLRPQSGK